MNKLILLVAVLALPIPANCQFTAGLNIGLNVRNAGIALPDFVQIEKDKTEKVLSATLGTGVNYNFELGYRLNDNVTANIDLGYFSSFTVVFINCRTHHENGHCISKAGGKHRELWGTKR